MKLEKLELLSEEQLANLTPEQIQEIIVMFNDLTHSLNSIFEYLGEVYQNIYNALAPFIDT